MKQLALEKHVYKVDTEAEGTELIESYKNKQVTDGYTLKKSSLDIKQKKSKGEVVDQYWLALVEMAYDVD